MLWSKIYQNTIWGNWLKYSPTGTSAWAAMGLAAFSFWRFCYLRDKATKIIYERYLLLKFDPDLRNSGE